MKKSSILNLVLAGLFTAIGFALPILFHILALSATVFLPMHIPILLAGLVCGWKYGLATGVIVPLLSSILTGMPPVYPVAVSMAFELATYGMVAGLLSRKFNTITALIIAMLSGRVVMGIANVVLLGLSGKTYALAAFLSGAFITALPGIIIQLILVPIIFTILKNSRSFERIL